MGAVPDLWTEYLKDFRDEEQWENLEDFVKTYTEFQPPIFDMLKYRVLKRGNYKRIQYVRNWEPVDFGDRCLNDIAGWTKMYDLLEQVQFHLGNFTSAEQSFWTVFMLDLFAAPWMTTDHTWRVHLHYLATCLYQQGERRRSQLETLISSYTVPVSQAMEALESLQ
jgi:hypothetical protein